MEPRDSVQKPGEASCPLKTEREPFSGPSLPDPSAPLILFSRPWALKGFALVAHEMLASPSLALSLFMHRLALVVPRDPGQFLNSWPTRVQVNLLGKLSLGGAQSKNHA